nr:MAG TPA: Glycogen synthesis protein [Bacteriophage sp.]
MLDGYYVSSDKGYPDVACKECLSMPVIAEAILRKQPAEYLHLTQTSCS